jgi:tRNA(fMet)-specific endonuclease VapC
MKYVLDTNTCISYLRGNIAICKKMEAIGFESLFISEITIFELYYGAAKSQNKDKHYEQANKLICKMQVLSILPSVLLFATEKARLAQLGMPIDNFDLLIGVTAIHYKMTMVTNNTKHFERLQSIVLEDWYMK